MVVGVGEDVGLASGVHGGCGCWNGSGMDAYVGFRLGIDDTHLGNGIAGRTQTMAAPLALTSH